jgi:hypothetical protein
MSFRIGGFVFLISTRLHDVLHVLPEAGQLGDVAPPDEELEDVVG